MLLLPEKTKSSLKMMACGQHRCLNNDHRGKRRQKLMEQAVEDKMAFVFQSRYEATEKRIISVIMHDSHSSYRKK
jgi:hypothetical protein